MATLRDWKAHLAGRKLILALGIASFVISLIIRIDAALIQTIFGLPDTYGPVIETIAAVFGAMGGILVAIYYLVGFITDRRSLKEGPSHET